MKYVILALLLAATVSAYPQVVVLDTTTESNPDRVIIYDPANTGRTQQAYGAGYNDGYTDGFYDGRGSRGPWNRYHSDCDDDCRDYDRCDRDCDRCDDDCYDYNVRMPVQYTNYYDYTYPQQYSNYYYSSYPRYYGYPQYYTVPSGGYYYRTTWGTY